MSSKQPVLEDPKDIDEYIGRFPDKVQPLLRKVRATIAKAAPEANEALAYQMPTFKPRSSSSR